MKSRVLALLALGILASAGAANAAFVGYSANITDVGTPSKYIWVLESDFAPLTGLNSYSFSGIISMTDAGADGVSASPYSFPEIWQLEVGNDTVWSIVDDVGGTATLSGEVPFNFSSSGVFDCTTMTSCTKMRLSTAFGLSGGSDKIDIGASFTFAPPAPLPATGWLLLSGLAGLGVLRRSKKQSKAD